MTRETPEREAEALRERISSLSSAILRVGRTLDVDVVLREAVDGACALTGAAYGVLATTAPSGSPQDFVSSGLTPEQARAVMHWPGRSRIFKHFRDLPAPLRISNLSEYVIEQGWAPMPIPCTSFQGTSMRFGDVVVGAFYLGEKKGGGDFTDADEEMLVMFASQVAAAVSNARTHREERRARADLEALVETSPVGVVAFDAKTGDPVWVNREARRIVSGILAPGDELNEVARELTCRRGNGQEVSLEEIGTAETLRAEEVELSLPDGRRVRMLISVTPTLSASGETRSIVVAMQDLAPLDELERLRAEFLGTVSHELRTPLAAIKGSAATVLKAPRSYDTTEVVQFFRIVDQEADRMDELIGDLLDVGRIEAGTLSVAATPTDVGALLEEARKTCLGGGGRHPILIDLPAGLPRAAADERRIQQVLNNLVDNAARHSPASAPIRLAASNGDGFLEISVTDGGDGVPEDAMPHLFRKHSGAGGNPRGAGLGLAICRGLVEAHGGRIRAESGGQDFGTRFTFTLPVADAAGEGAGGPARQAPAPPRSPSGQATILVVDDDPRTTRYVRDSLADADYVPVVTGDPGEVADLLDTRNPDLVLMDLVLPDVDGIELLHSLPGLAERPVIFISAYGRDETIARALEAGARDYIVKPFSPTELTARVRAALRGRVTAGPFVLGDLAIDYERRRVTIAGERIKLTATEYDLLRVLSLHEDRVLTFDALLRAVWQSSDGDPNLVRTFVKKLRRKLGDPAGAPKYVVNERGVGYRMAGPNRP